jgi:methenyltetrahydromethanopterin cyclohydrolase
MIHINARAAALAQTAIADREVLGIGYRQLACGAHLLDFGLEVKGSWEAALIFTRLTLGDLGTLQLGRWELDRTSSCSCVDLFISEPLIACLASQIAGWQLSDGEFATIGSGPARAAAVMASDQYLDMTPYRDPDPGAAVLCIQDTRYPSEQMAEHIAEACSVDCSDLYLAIAPSNCITGSVQVAARMLEQCCHKMREHGFDVAGVEHCRGRAPIAPVCADEITAMGRINDAILYGGEAEFWVDSTDEQLQRIAPQLVSSTSSPEYGIPFKQIFEKAGRNFYAIDHEVHSIAMITLHNTRTGNSVTAGEINRSVLKKSFLTGC